MSVFNRSVEEENQTLLKIADALLQRIKMNKRFAQRDIDYNASPEKVMSEET